MTERIQPVAIVGAGVSGLIAYVNLRYEGLSTEDIAVFDDNPACLRNWTRGTDSIRQCLMRSESEGHFFTTDFPGFALLDAIHSMSLLPLIQSVFNVYHPTVDAVVRHGRALGDHYRIEASVRRTRVRRLAREVEPFPHFVLSDVNGQICGRARHVLLALGHGPLRWPEVCAEPETRAELQGVLFHAYEPKAYGGRNAIVIGSGMGAASEWTNLLNEGGRVFAVRRSATLVEQPLSAPRCAFGGPWLDRYHALGSTERAAILANTARGSFSKTKEWKRLLQDAERDGRLERRVGELTEVRRNADSGVTVTLRRPHGEGTETLHAGMVIAATGFQPGWQGHTLLRTLVDEHDLETYGGHLVLGDDCSVPRLSTPESTLAVAGPAGRWAYPASDSFAGMKYAARRFSRQAVATPYHRPRRIAAWWDMVRGGWPYANDHDERERGATSCASR